MADILWCCHVRGSDDVHAAPDYATALKWSDLLNAVNWDSPRRTVRPPASYRDCLIKAVPAIWPWSAEQHAADLRKSIEAFEIPETESP